MDKEERIRKILDDESQSHLIIIDGRSGSGKSRLIKKVLAEYDKSVKISYSDFIELLICDIKSRTDYFRESLFRYKIIAFDDIDFLRNKYSVQETSGCIINSLMKSNTHVIMIGIDLIGRVPILLSTVNKEVTTWITLH